MPRSVDDPTRGVNHPGEADSEDGHSCPSGFVEETRGRAGDASPEKQKPGVHETPGIPKL